MQGHFSNLFRGREDNGSKGAQFSFPGLYLNKKFNFLINIFKISHTMSISQATTGYRFGATFIGNHQIGPNESFPVMLGDMDLQGNTAGTILHQIGKYRMKFQGQVQV